MRLRRRQTQIIFVKYFTFLLAVFSSLSACDYISITLKGSQLGNQMFHAAACLSYAWDHDLIPVFPELSENANQLSYNKDRIFFRLDPSSSPIPLTKYETLAPNYEPLPSDLANVLLDGGFFSWKYFDHHREKIQEVFAPSEEIVSYLHHKYGSLLAQENTVAVHLRTYSKKVHEEGLHFVGMPFFESAMEKFPNDSVFVIFSDRINWTKAHFQKQFPDKKLLFIEGNDHIEDLFLMSMMKHQILSRSTFSWWAAYLNQNTNKIVIAPALKGLGLPSWLKIPLFKLMSYFGKRTWINEEYHLPEWETLYYTVEPYPSDIYAYGDESKSVEPADK